MTARQLYYSKEEFARRGHEIYESQVRQQVEQGNRGRIVMTRNWIFIKKEVLEMEPYPTGVMGLVC